MQSFPLTYILRHRRENLKKCCLRGLEKRDDFGFYTYPTSILPATNGYLLLALDAPLLSAEDSAFGLFLIDATWRYAEKMLTFVDKSGTIERRSIPPGFITAYPRRQDDCPFPDQGLASIEALYIAYKILGRDVDSLLDNYYWKADFLEKNRLIL
jgi:pre-rRNA-processing protein TSR3